jgi:diguanylate cyclase (GGDEF)-like protein
VFRQRAAWAAAGVTAVVAAALIGWAIPQTARFLGHAPSAFWAIAVLAVLVDIPVYALARRSGYRPRTTLSVCFTFAIFLIWGAGPAILVQAVSATFAAIGQHRTLRSGAFLVSRLIWALAAAEVVVGATTGRPLTRPGEGLTGDDVVSFLIPSVVWFVVSFGLLVLARTAVFGVSLLGAVTDVREDVLATAVSILLVSPLLTTMTGWSSVLVALPLFAWNQLSREWARQEQRMRREPVTGLLNRRGLVLSTQSLVGEDILEPGRQRPFGIILYNVESVLVVNRTLGRDLYERLVAAAGRRLVATFGYDRVGRLSGEGFVVLAPGLTESDAVEVANRGVAALQRPLEVDQIPFALDPAAGVALSPQHGSDLAVLVAKAELAMGEARRLGVPATSYVHQAREITQRRIDIIGELRAALSDPTRWDEIGVVYQPQVRLSTGRLAGAEALVRWTHPDWGPVQPDELIEAVEPTEVMHLLTRHMLDRVVSQIRTWADRGLRLRVAVNASVQDLHAPEFPAEISDLLMTYGVTPDQLTIEITERMLIDDPERVARAAERIAALGVGLSLDDFGTGYASMQQLRVLPLAEVKIDKSYVQGMTDNESQRAIVTSVHQLAAALRLAVVAEGVEDEQTAAALGRLPGTIGQGWHFGRPIPAAEFEARWHPAPAYSRG